MKVYVLLGLLMVGLVQLGDAAVDAQFPKEEKQYFARVGQ